MFLSKSSILEYERCPLSFYYSKIEFRKGLPNPYFDRGSQVHEAIKNYYDSGVLYSGEHLDMFTNFLSFHGLVGKPIIWEEKVKCEELKLKGVIDAYFNDGMLVDFKTSAKPENDLEDYRFELAVYKLLLEKQGVIVEKWGIPFLKSGHFSWENSKDMSDDIEKRAEAVREGVKNKEFEPKKNKFCFSCGYRNICPLMKENR